MQQKIEKKIKKELKLQRASKHVEEGWLLYYYYYPRRSERGCMKNIR